MKKRKPPKTEHLKPTQFKKGQSGNPNGRPPLNPIQRALKELTVDTYREVVELVLTGNLDSLKEIAESKTAAAIQVGLARAFLKAIKEGNHEVIERMAERIVGKIPDQINLVSKNLNANMDVPAESKVTHEEVKAAFDELDREV
jgi:hypothetical protein